MTAQEQMKKMLDELMGTQRDGARPEDVIKFTDDRVCKSFLMGLCPHELFNNTKMDLGPCNKIHDPALKADFEIASQKRDYGYDIDQMEHLQSFIKDCDRKIQIAKKRLEETQDDHDLVPEAQAVHDLAEQIGKKLAEAESMGAEGKVDESMELMKEVDDLKQKKRMAEDIYRETLPSSSLQQQKLRVCEVCAAYLSLYDNDRRLADHFGGKLHMGFIKIRDRLKELQEGVAKKRSEREMERMRRREEREREREQERREREKRMREREREREKERSRRRRSRSRSRSRERRRRRRSRSYSRSRSRSRSGSRSRTKNKSSSRRSRSRSVSPKRKTPPPQSPTRSRSRSKS